MTGVQTCALPICSSGALNFPATVKLINLIVRISDGTNNGGVNAFIVKTWNKNNDDDEIDEIEMKMNAFYHYILNKINSKI